VNGPLGNFARLLLVFKCAAHCAQHKHTLRKRHCPSPVLGCPVRCQSLFLVILPFCVFGKLPVRCFLCHLESLGLFMRRNDTQAKCLTQAPACVVLTRRTSSQIPAVIGCCRSSEVAEADLGGLVHVALVLALAFFCTNKVAVRAAARDSAGRDAADELTSAVRCQFFAGER